MLNHWHIMKKIKNLKYVNEIVAQSVKYDD